VISRYCEVDAANCDVTFERQDKQVAMLANIPILGMQRPKPPAPPPPAPPPPSNPGLPDGTAASGALATATPSPAEQTSAPTAKPTGKPGGANGRRRRRKQGVQGAPRPQPT
jgi:hypothetical protein